MKYACSSFEFEKRKSYFVGDRNSPSANADFKKEALRRGLSSFLQLKSVWLRRVMNNRDFQYCFDKLK